MNSLNQTYFDLLWRNRERKAESITLKSEENQSNIIPFSITSEEQEKSFSLSFYNSLTANRTALKNVNLKILKMQAGIGSSVERKDLLKKDRMSAKGVDLFLKYNEADYPIAQIHLFFFEELRRRAFYKKVSFQSLVNDETKDDIVEISKGHDTLTSIEQEKMPTIKNGELSHERLAPGGHGFIGFHEIMDAINTESDEICCIGNGEDLNSTVDEKIISHIAQNNIPILMITTDKTAADLKGGQLALVESSEGQYITIIEKAQAEEAGQLEYFEQLGLREGDKKALFNTNIVVLNKKAIRKSFLEFEGDIKIESLFDEIAPDVILNKKEQDGEDFIQLESALGSVILNFDKYFRLRHGNSLVSILNLEEENRTKFFLPIKKRADYDDIRSNYIISSDDLKLVKK